MRAVSRTSPASAWHVPALLLANVNRRPRLALRHRRAWPCVALVPAARPGDQGCRRSWSTHDPPHLADRLAALRRLLHRRRATSWCSSPTAQLARDPARDGAALAGRPDDGDQWHHRDRARALVPPAQAAPPARRRLRRRPAPPPRGPDPGGRWAGWSSARARASTGASASARPSGRSAWLVVILLPGAP